MDTSTNNIFTPVTRSCGLRYNTPSSGKNGSCTPKSLEKISKTMLTPCRRIGLKRKSLGEVKKSLLKNTNVEHFSGNSKADINFVSEVNDYHMEETKSLHLSNDRNVEKSQLAESDENYVLNGARSKCFKTEHVIAVNSFSDSCPLLSKPEIIDLKVLNALATSIKDKKEQHKHIELSKLYEKKHNLQTLQELNGKWKQGCQNALLELHQLLQESGHTVKMPHLLAQFQIPHDLISYNEDSDDFE